MNGETANDFLSRMTVKLGTTSAQLRDTLLGNDSNQQRLDPVKPPVFITGSSPFIKILKPRQEQDLNQPTIVKTLLTTTGSEESQNFLSGTDKMSTHVKTELINWATDYFALQLGVQDALEFSAQTIPSDIGVEKAFIGVKNKVETAMLQRLVSSLSIDVLKCDPQVMEIFNGSSRDAPGSPTDIINRFLKMAKDASDKNGGKK